MSTSREWQLDLESARRYEQVVVPLILGPSARALVDWSGLEPGDRVLDIGCGTGIAARFALERVGPHGTVSGADMNEGMLAVAREVGPEITFHIGNAMALPLSDSSFERIICAQVLQFLPDRQAGVAEMARLLTPGGGVAVSVWGQIEDSPYFDAQVSVVTEYLGSEVGGGLAAGFTLTSMDELASILTHAELSVPEVSTTTLNLPIGKLDETIPRHIMATPMAAGFAQATPEVRDQITRDVIGRLTNFIAEDGTATVPFRINMARASHIGA